MKLGQVEKGVCKMDKSIAAVNTAALIAQN